MSEGSAFLSFKRSRFKTRLPRGRFYTPGHMWLRPEGEGLWHIGLTRFALRMLGEPVEADFEAAVGATIETGQAVGWLEGFKAVTDLYSPMNGVFDGGNGALDGNIECLHKSPYDQGWIFAMRGEPGEDCVDAEGYASFLDATIDRMMEAES